jgi:Skp family chaperone for outer membrane proteins
MNMKSGHLVLVMLALSATAMSSHAEIYKWKDKNGATRYSDTPPPSNIKQEAIGKKKAIEPTGQAPLAPVAAKEGKKEEMSKEDEAAKKRQAEAEADKKAKQEKEKQELAQAENCKLARANLATFKNGGRITKTDENGERIYLDDKDIEKGKVQAQEDVNKYCI